MMICLSNFIILQIWLICLICETYEEEDFSKYNFKIINESDADKNQEHYFSDRGPHWHAKVTVIKEFIFYPDKNTTLNKHGIRTSGNYSFNNRVLNEAKLNCGKPNNMIENPYPWMVGIFIKSSKKYEFQCSGSLITTRHILTAAHCLYKSELSTKNIISKYKTREVFVAFPHKTESLSKKLYPVQHLIPHNKFSKFVNDVGIIELDENKKWKIHPFIRPICVAGITSPLSTFSAGQKLTVAGWIPSADQRFLTQAREVTMIDRLNCQKYLLQKITEGHICSRRDDEGACQNSTGGPLMRIQENRWNLDGIVAFNKKCLFYPPVYSNIAKYIPWIKKTIQ